MGGECTCEVLLVHQETRLALWRDACTRFFYDHDAVAKRVLDHFEATRVDQIVIETEPPAATVSDSDATFRQIVESLGLYKCAVAGSSHEQSYYEVVVAMERVKNEVRGAYHRHTALKNYDEFAQRVAHSGQSTNYEVVDDGEGFELLRIRLREKHVRSVEEQSRQLSALAAFVKTHVSNIGCHPFLAGLRHVLEWNLVSDTVVAWKISDAVFVESGISFAEAALKLMIQELNCGHHDVPLAHQPDDSDSVSSHVRQRVWYIDAYMSDNDMKQLLKALPAPSRLESRGTGEQLPTAIVRQNADGKFDEFQPFFQRWCVIL